MAKDTDNSAPQSLQARAWRKFKKNRLATFGMGILGFLVLLSILGANVRPDDSEDTNNQIPALVTKKPGFTIDILRIRKNKEVEESNFFDRLAFGYAKEVDDYYPIEGYRIDGAYIYIEEYTEIPSKKGVEQRFLLANVLYALDDTLTRLDGQGNMEFYLLGGDKMTRSIAEMQEEVVSDKLENTTFWLGTDALGRDYLSRLMAGIIVSLLVGLISVMISLLIGVTMGALAGFFRGWVDDVVMYLINVVWSIPTILMVFAITLMLGKGFWQVFVAVGLTMWVEVARIVRGQVLSVREQEFVEAGRALGFRSPRLIIKHVLPNVMGPVIVISAANFAAAILIEAGLSFLGIGTQLPDPSWGNMVKEHMAYLTTEHSYLAVLPGVAIIIMVLALMLIGNALRDALDSRSAEVIVAN